MTTGSKGCTEQGRSAKRPRVLRACEGIVVVVALSTALSGCQFILSLIGGGNGGNSTTASLPPCSTISGSLLTTLPASTSDFDLFMPLGHLEPPGHTLPTDHHYFFANDNTKVFPVVSPANGTITKLQVYYHNPGASQGWTDYDIRFHPCNEVEIRFGHITQLTPSLQQKVAGASGCTTYTSGTETVKFCTIDVSIPVSAGDPFGEAGGQLPHGFDFGVHDNRISNQFVNQHRYDQYGQYLEHAASALDYFDTADSSTLESMMWSFDHSVRRTAPPLGGTADQDIAGTVQGNWFPPTDPTINDSYDISLAHDSFDYSIPVLSIGTTLTNVPEGTYQVTSVQTSGLVNRDFPDVTADGNIYRYDVNGGMLLLQLIDTNTLKIEWQSSSAGPPWGFTAAAQEYVR